MKAKCPDIDPRGLYNQAQASKALGVNRHTIKKWVEAGVLPCKIRKVDLRGVIEGKELIKLWSKKVL